MTLFSGTWEAIDCELRAIPMESKDRAALRRSKSICALLAAASILLTPSGFALQSQSKGGVDFQQAESLLQQNRLVEARALALRGLLADPSSLRGYTLLGMIEAGQQDYTDAAKAFEKALEIESHLDQGAQQPGQRLCGRKEIRPGRKGIPHRGSPCAP